MTLSEYIDWLKDVNAIRVLLMEITAEVAGIETTFYFSDKGYVTGMAFQDVPQNTHYEPRIVAGVSFSEQIALDGSAASSFGDVDMLNADGLLDVLMNHAFAKRRMKLWHGDASFSRDQFFQVMDGVVLSADPRERGRMAVRIADKLQRLNTPLSEEIIGGTGPNKNELRPVCFGEVHNVEGVLYSAGTLDYYLHSRNMERIIEGRDNGVPINYQAYLTNGRVRLTASPAGLVTWSVQGDRDPILGDAAEAYVNNAGALIRRITTQFGNIFDRYTLSDIDTVNFDAFIAANPQPVGYFTSERVSVLDACVELAGSVGAHLVVSRTGKLRLVKIALPSTPVWSAGVGDMVNGTMQPVESTEVSGAVKLGYCKNYTVQNGLLTGILETHKALFAQEFLTKSSFNEVVRARERQTKEPEIEPTLLLVGADAQAEADRRRALREERHRIYRWTGYAEALAYQLGDGITVTHPRFELENGKNGVIVGLMPDYVEARCVVEVLI